MSGGVPALLDRWQPERLATAATRTRMIHAHVESVRADLAATVGATLLSLAAWSGMAATRCRTALDERSAVLRAVAVRLTELAVLLDQAAIQLTERVARARSAQARVADAESGLQGATRLLTPLAWAWVQQQHETDLRTQLTELQVTDRRLGGELEASARAARALRREHDAELMRADSGAVAGRWSQGDPIAASPPGVDAQDTADWWAALTPGERARLGSGPLAARLGRIDGLPAQVRDRANRLALAARLRSYDAVRAGPLERTAHAVDLLVDTELHRLAALAGGLPVLLLLDDPSRWSGKGRVAIAVGDPDVAANVAYLVPGLDDRAITSLRIDNDHAMAVARSAAAASATAGSGTAVVAWLGYDTPTLRTVTSSAPADHGAELLAEAVSGLLASRGSGNPHLTVVGHSYGSTTAALATVRAPGSVDDLVLVGSPGAAVEQAVNLPVPAGHVWVGSSDDDLVTRLAWFGPDPAGAQFGAQRFPAEVTAPGSGVFDAHGHYFDDAGQSLSEIGRIVAGAGTGVPSIPGR